MEVFDQSLVKGEQEGPSPTDTMEAPDRPGLSEQSDQVVLSNQSVVKVKKKCQSFHMFMNLPPEIRYMIWKLAMPKRVILPRPSGFTLAPRLPSLSQVCRESRAFVLGQGMLCYHQQWTKRPSTAWLNPDDDVVFFQNIPDHISSHPVSDKFLMDHATRIAIEIPNVVHSISYLVECTTSVKEVLVVMNTWNQAFPPRSGSWGSDLNKRVFGDDGWICVDLYDQDEVTRADNMLYENPKTYPLGEALSGVYRHIFDGLTDEERWIVCMHWTKKQWLIDAYFLEENARGSGGVRSSAMESFEYQVCKDKITWRDAAWVKKTLDRMPELRPVFLAVDRFYSPSFIQNRRPKGRKAKQPAYSFDNQLKRWVDRDQTGGSQAALQPGAMQGAAQASRRRGWEALMSNKLARESM